ncbi:fused MFS/spermidine synthase [Sphingomonas japonica]|uniref:Spermidine synthase n=1 Tax=Sphingomonas japonica TaxID=511662 RepID=A0ABX0U879_9SPHN|nr:fused MFS/spermidine synthase [Sphingomonas japonica]NIJ25007.1 spermidine synthase [Sphingomonas japonica]
MDAVTEPAQRGATRWGGALFVVAILTGSFLLFLVQPMIARMALPRIGGAPAVWNSAMLVYQALLLGGYAYAHWLGRIGIRTQAAIHLGLLAIAALWLPIGLGDFRMPPGGEPALWVPWLLAASIGPLFLAVSAQAPLLQRWYNAASGGRDPYALYAASNLGSFGGLIAYPLIVEPALALDGQSVLWSIGYGALFLLVAACALLLPKGAAAEVAARVSETPTATRVLLWIALAFVPSGLMLATSTFLTTDIVAVPLLWVLPLGLYLLSFSIAFAGGRTIADLLTKVAPITILLFGGLVISCTHENPFLNAGVALVLLFMVAVALHTRMYDLRPAPDRLTGFYLAMSLGGALGGVFAGLIAPVVFDWTYEYPLLILAGGALVPQAFLLPAVAQLWQSGMAWRVAAFTAAVAALAWLGIANPGEILGPKAENLAFLGVGVLGLAAIGARVPFVIALTGALFIFGGYRALAVSIDGDSRTRSYFGVYTITDYPSERTLAHGTTLHGTQLVGSAERERQPTTYYVPGSGVGQAMLALGPLFGPGARVGVVGLGTGTLACYKQPDQRWRFYEIDPVMVEIARDSGKFSFLRNCAPNVPIVIGDARLRLEEAAPDSLDLLALDAFSSDAVPMHLMTEEAFATYSRVLSPEGVLLVHISNRFLSLEPIVSATARSGKWWGAMLSYVPEPDATGDATMSDWIALTQDPASLAVLMIQNDQWRPLPSYREFAPWTDDYATILPVLRSLDPDLP